jgi:mannose-1-phosphate guanylyltransferase
MNLHLLVLAGGTGTRFWPKSTLQKPKQFLSFDAKGQSLLAQTLGRFEHWIALDQTWVITSESLRETVSLMHPYVRVFGEPQARNTAACIYWGAQLIAQEDPHAVMVVVPSDHWIVSEEVFREVVQTAVFRASAYPELITLGVVPTRPETGYGYLKFGKCLDEETKLQKVEAFIEKPDFDRACLFLESQKYFWNAGIFVWRVGVLLQAFDRYLPEMQEIWKKAQGNVEEAYRLFPSISIDYAIMEKADCVVGFPLDCGWDDLGSWNGLEFLADILGKRQGGNMVFGGELLAMEASENAVDVPGKFVALLGVKDLVIVENGERLLVAHKSKAQEIRKLVQMVEKQRPDLV